MPGSLVFTPTQRPGRPAPPEPVVDLDAGRLLERARGAGQLGQATAPTTRSCTSPTRTPRRTPLGRAPTCPPRPSGSTPPAAASRAPTFTWGDEARPGGRIMANTWDGPDFPWRSTGRAAGCAPSPVGQLPGQRVRAVRHGRQRLGVDRRLVDRAATPTTPTARAARPTNPRGGDVEASYDPAQPQFRVARKVIKGGSHLCADTYCLRYRPAARRPQMVDTGMSHLGFRCVRASSRHRARRTTSMTIRRCCRRGGPGRPATPSSPSSTRVGRRPAGGPGGLLRQRRHAVVRAPDVRPARLLRRRAASAGADDPTSAETPGVRRPARAATRPPWASSAWSGSPSP